MASIGFLAVKILTLNSHVALPGSEIKISEHLNRRVKRVLEMKI